MKMNFVSLLMFYSVFYGCNVDESEGTQTPLYDDSKATLIKYEAKPLQIKDDDEGLGADIRMSVTEIKQLDTGILYKVNALNNNSQIGFDIIAPLTKSGRLKFRSAGNISDSFIAFFGKLYRQKLKPDAKFVNYITVECIDLGEFIDSLYQHSEDKYEKIHEYKLFFEGKTEQEYAELFLNINKEEHWIEMAEKDEEYRPALIRMFSGE